MAQNTVVFVIAHQGYQPIEYSVPKKLLENAGFTVVTASNKSGTATAKDNSTTEVNLLVNDINIADYKGIFFIGGPGALEHLDNEASYRVIKKIAQIGKPFGAICVSTRILAKSGVLKDKRATGWDGDGELSDIYKKYNVNYVHEGVVVDGNIITATGPSVAHEFGERIIALLQEQNGWD